MFKVDFTLCTFITNDKDYLWRFAWAFPTWSSKPQFKDVPIVIFTSGFNGDYKKLEFIKEYFSNWTFVDWKYPKAQSIKETVYSAYFFGTEFIKTPYFVKLDCDSFFIDKQDVWEPDDLNYDCVGHSWGYTKPGYWIAELDNAYKGENKPYEKLPVFGHSRFASFCCLHKTSFMKMIADKMPNGRLPVPSHDTTLWYYADKLGKWKGKKIKRYGVDTCTRWKNIRECVCSGGCNNNPMLNRELLGHVQLEITTDCQLKCFNCDRNCGTAPSNEGMSVEQVWKFVEESIANKHAWKRIDIIGGEPTLYHDLQQVWRFIKLYKDKYPHCEIRFSTNGFGEKAQAALKDIPAWVTVRNSAKAHREQEFVAINSAPVDNGEKDIRACSVPWRCGMALTRYGYFLCGAGASIARVFGRDIGIKFLNEVNPEAILAQISTLCKLCGHSRVKSRHVTKKQEISKSWQTALATYKEHDIGQY